MVWILIKKRMRDEQKRVEQAEMLEQARRGDEKPDQGAKKAESKSA
jgi:hypothetical protein